MCWEACAKYSLSITIYFLTIIWYTHSYVSDEQQRSCQENLIASVENVVRDIFTRGSLSTALCLLSAVDKDSRVKTDCTTFFTPELHDLFCCPSPTLDAISLSRSEDADLAVNSCRCYVHKAAY